MCGIWGLFPNDNKGFYNADTTVMENSMILTSIRGAHSTGLAMVGDAKAKPRTWKTVGGPAFLLNSDAWDKIATFAVQKAKVMFGHGRYATKGAINAKNAHPFTHEHITLVHNGTIHFGLKEVHDEHEIEVDSHALCASIAQKGLVPALESIYGAYALIVHDAKEGCVYIVRNDERPLHRLVLTDKHILLSEYEACKYLAAKMGVTNPKIEVYPKHVIFKYDIPTATWSTDDSLLKLMEKKYSPTTTTTPWTGATTTTYSKGGGRGTSGSKLTGIHETTFYCNLDLLCTKIEPVETTKQYRYFMYDDAGLEYHALSAHHYKERIGEIARILKHTKIVDRSSGEVTRFVKFRDIDWNSSKSTELTVVKMDPEPNPEIVQTYNNYLLKWDQWRAYINKEDCAVCGGPILEKEAENTIVTQSKTLICGDCIAQGKHYMYGYGQ